MTFSVTQRVRRVRKKRDITDGGMKKLRFTERLWIRKTLLEQTSVERREGVAVDRQPRRKHIKGIYIRYDVKRIRTKDLRENREIHRIRKIHKRRVMKDM